MAAPFTIHRIVELYSHIIQYIYMEQNGQQTTAMQSTDSLFKLSSISFITHAEHTSHCATATTVHAI